MVPEIWPKQVGRGDQKMRGRVLVVMGDDGHLGDGHCQGRDGRKWARVMEGVLQE